MTTASTPAPQRSDKPESTQSPLTAWVIPIVVNIVLPILTYAVLSGAGMGDVPALLLSGVWPVLETVVTVSRQHHLDEFAIFVILGILAGIATTLFSDNARAVFLKDSIATGVVGLAFLITLLVGKPLTFFFGRRFATDGSREQRDWWNGLWVHDRFRMIQRRLCLAWGTALLGEAIIRAILTRQLGTTSMVVVNNVVPYVVIAAMIAVSVTVGKREQRLADEAGYRDAAPPASV